MENSFIRVLMVDDDEDDFLLTQTMLKKVDGAIYTVKWASTYQAGLEQILSYNYDAVIVDYDLGAHTGIDFVREAIAEGCSAPLILYTGHGSYQLDVKAMHTGVAGYIPKSEATPFLLERSIRYAMERKEKEAELRIARDQARESEERLYVALATTPISIFTQDRDLRFTWVNNPQLGLLPEQMIGKRDQELFASADIAALLKLKNAVIETEEGIKTELDIQIRDRRQHIILALEPIFNENGTVIGITGAVLDRTDQYEMEIRQFRHTAEMEVKRRLLEHREMERQEIARNLHDGPIQDLLGLMFPLQTALSVSENAETAQLLRDTREGMQALVKNLRDLCNELRPPSLVMFGLEKAIRSHVQEFQNKNHLIQVELDLAWDGNRLPMNIRLALYRVYQEAMNNAARHGEASRIVVRFMIDQDRVTLSIDDNGKGFDLPEDFVELARQQHFGLIGMKERVEGIGGELQLQSRQNEGTSLLITAPLVDGNARLVA